MLIYVPHLNHAFNHFPISWHYWLIVIAFIPSVFIFDELRKLILRMINRRTLNSTI